MIHIQHHETCRTGIFDKEDRDSLEDGWLRHNSDRDLDVLLTGRCGSSDSRTKSEGEENDDQDPSPSDSDDTDTFGDLTQQSSTAVISLTNPAFSLADVEDQQEAIKCLLCNPYTLFETAFNFTLTRWMVDS